MTSEVSIICDKFIIEHVNNKNMVLWNDRVFLYTSWKYRFLSRAELESYVFNWYRSKYSNSINYRSLLELVNLIRLSLQRIEKGLNTVINPHPSQIDYDYIPMKNSIVRLDIRKNYLSVGVTDHTPSIFSTYCLEYEYREKAGCKNFISFLESIFDTEEICLLQEWAGYLLIPNNFAQKMMLLYGEGANGKSVICQILRLLLGEQNVSSVPLHSFLPNSRFGLADTEGMLANIVEEIDEVD